MIIHYLRTSSKAVGIDLLLRVWAAGVRARRHTSQTHLPHQALNPLAINEVPDIIKKKLKLDASLYTLLQILSVTLFEKVPLQQPFPSSEYILPQGVPYNQLNIFTIWPDSSVSRHFPRRPQQSAFGIQGA